MNDLDPKAKLAINEYLQKWTIALATVGSLAGFVLGFLVRDWAYSRAYSDAYLAFSGQLTDLVIKATDAKVTANTAAESTNAAKAKAEDAANASSKAQKSAEIVSETAKQTADTAKQTAERAVSQADIALNDVRNAQYAIMSLMDSARGASDRANRAASDADSAKRRAESVLAPLLRNSAGSDLVKDIVESLKNDAGFRTSIYATLARVPVLVVGNDGAGTVRFEDGKIIITGSHGGKEYQSIIDAHSFSIHPYDDKVRRDARVSLKIDDDEDSTAKVYFQGIPEAGGKALRRVLGVGKAGNIDDATRVDVNPQK